MAEKQKTTLQDINKAIANLSDVCEKHSIKFNPNWYTFEDGDFVMTVNIQEGRGERIVAIPILQSYLDYCLQIVNDFIDSNFQDYCFIKGYEAICRKDYTYIEAILMQQGERYPIEGIYTTLTKAEEAKDASIIKDVSSMRLKLDSPSMPGIELEIAPTSLAFKALFRPRISNEEKCASIIITGFNRPTHDDALDFLIKITNSLFFQIDVVYGSIIMLQRHIEGRPPLDGSSRKTAPSLQFPEFCYELEPINCYWYAKTAKSMPLLQFLAYYQVMEYYFINYSNIQAINKVKSILKEPSFTKDDDNDIKRIVSSLVPNLRGGYGKEEDQLISVIQHCIDANELKKYMAEHKVLSDYYKNEKNGLSRIRISVEKKDAELLVDLAKRIYNLRCRIVHTKDEHSDELNKPIFPFSEEEKLLENENMLMEYLAQKILIVNSKRFK